MSQVVEREISAPTLRPSTRNAVVGRPATPRPARHANATEPTYAVPTEYLDPPDRDDIKNIDRDAAAVILDELLVRLVRRESQLRLRLGKIAATLLESRAYHRLGFARAGDYTRERIGLSQREVQSMVRVWRRLAVVPSLGAAYLSGRLGWTKLRILCEIAQPESAERWISIANAMTASRLAETVKRERKRRDSESCSSLLFDTTLQSLEEGENFVDGEPRATVRISVPRYVRPLWRQARELASRSAGSELSTWQALEAICGEAMSAVPFAGSGLVESHPYVSPTSELRPPRANVVEDIRELLTLTTPDLDNDEIAGSRVGLATVGPANHLDGATANLNFDAARADPGELDRKAREAVAAMQEIDSQIGSILATVERLRLHRNLGYTSQAQYVSDRLGMSERKARTLARIAKKSASHGGVLGNAYRSGAISWVRAATLLPVLNETNAAAWVERAKRVTVRRLANEVRWALDMADRAGGLWEIHPPELGASLDRSDAAANRQIGARQFVENEARCSDDMVTLVFSGPASVIDAFLEALGAYRDLSKPAEPAWVALERFLLDVVSYWETLPRHRNPIHERDGWRCRVPACSSRRNLQEHHIVFRSRGGGNDRSNRVSICAWHHLRGVHQGRVHATGDAEGRIRWKLGGRWKFEDDVYL